MVEIIKVSKESVPAMRFIGKKYGNEDRVDGHFGDKWSEFISNGWFDILDKLTASGIMTNALALIGHENNSFKYWIGKFAPANTSVPEGFDCIDFESGNFVAVRLKGPEWEIFGNEPMCCDYVKEQGMEVLDLQYNCFERYRNCDDNEDNTLLQEGDDMIDICFFVA